MKILLVEDEQKLASALKKGLELHGYTADIVADGKKALTRISLHRTDYDLVILDLMLPGMDGIELLSRLRRESEVYVIMLTARTEETDKIIGLSVGADDAECVGRHVHRGEQDTRRAQGETQEVAWWMREGLRSQMSRWLVLRSETHGEDENCRGLR